MKFSVFQVSRQGGRAKNEDRMGYSYTRDSAVFVLADGMGGHPEGEVAAQIALESVSALFQTAANERLDSPGDFLVQAMMAAHHQIIRYASEHGMLDTPRTTVVVAVVQDGYCWWVHCGDSRFYLVRDGELMVRTRDHSYLEQGGGEELRGMAINRNVLFTCLGSPTKPIYDIGGPQPLLQGDKILLCSDGLWGTLDDEIIVADLDRLAVGDGIPLLVEKALTAGGERCDNVTALALEWETPDRIHGLGDISTEGLVDGVYASTIRPAGFFDEPDDEDEVLDDEAIERNIAEINAAIRRSARGGKE